MLTWILNCSNWGIIINNIVETEAIKGLSNANVEKLIQEMLKWMRRGCSQRQAFEAATKSLSLVAHITYSTFTSNLQRLVNPTLVTPISILMRHVAKMAPQVEAGVSLTRHSFTYLHLMIMGLLGSSGGQAAAGQGARSGAAIVGGPWVLLGVGLLSALLLYTCNQRQVPECEGAVTDSNTGRLICYCNGGWQDCP